MEKIKYYITDIPNDVDKRIQLLILLSESNCSKRRVNMNMECDIISYSMDDERYYFGYGRERKYHTVITYDEFISMYRGNTKKEQMKPFDLEKALAGEPVITRDGRKARIVCTYKNDDNNYQVVAMSSVVGQDTEFPYICSNDGVSIEGYKHLDLFMKHKIVVYHYCIYKLNNCGSCAYTTSPLFDSEEDVRSFLNTGTTAIEYRTINIEE